jgi:hypothetical protein
LNYLTRTTYISRRGQAGEKSFSYQERDELFYGLTRPLEEVDGCGVDGRAMGRKGISDWKFEISNRGTAKEEWRGAENQKLKLRAGAAKQRAETRRKKMGERRADEEKLKD